MVYNFSAGPAVLPKEVLLQTQQELLDWHGSGMSVMEMSHRGPEFTQIIQEAEADLRELMAIPANYKVLFLQGGATTQFSAIPMNLIGRTGKADYVHTGHWSKGAINEAKRYGDIHLAASGEDRHFTYIPDPATWQVRPDAAYLHYTPNETIGGVEYQFVPEVGDIPLVADMSSNILSRSVDVSKFGLIYAGAQKNIGPSGLVIVIVREDLLGHALPSTPKLMDYKLVADNDSMLNTPATFAVYVAGLIFKWLKVKGGVAGIEQLNIAKANKVYEAIDQSGGFYRNPVALDCRSRMNIPFVLQDDALNAPFLKAAAERHLLQLKGHKSVGGMRASIYNAMPMAGVDALIDFMREFAARHA
ncbi:3-phosphoserine/phosphohydroxythreonine transaminase [Chitinivorax sp. B]|uniref:3-phosphoserine/phosphohydroxythreonine transaminase n=1 Tax=Chitinivorax sp. B TaxID=2502235 RepID=UPI0010F9C3AA|nr:3-phosphoserine/phosphohydroxythreonine transaminase [Chitinivorax sp. B]